MYPFIFTSSISNVRGRTSKIAPKTKKLLLVPKVERHVKILNLVVPFIPKVERSRLLYEHMTQVAKIRGTGLLGQVLVLE